MLGKRIAGCLLLLLWILLFTSFGDSSPETGLIKTSHAGVSYPGSQFSCNTKVFKLQPISGELNQAACFAVPGVPEVQSLHRLAGGTIFYNNEKPVSIKQDESAAAHFSTTKI